MPARTSGCRLTVTPYSPRSRIGSSSSTVRLSISLSVSSPSRSAMMAPVTEPYSLPVLPARISTSICVPSISDASSRISSRRFTRVTPAWLPSFSTRCKALCVAGVARLLGIR